MTDLSLPRCAEDLVPHRAPMLLIDRLIAVNGKNGIVEARVGTDSLLTSDDGRLEEAALIEIIAQSYAALKGYIDRRDQLPVRRGFLVGVKRIDCHADVHIGDLLQVHIHTLAELDDFAVAEGEIRRRDEVIAHGDLKVWIN